MVDGRLKVVVGDGKVVEGREKYDGWGLNIKFQI
jgi:hypothetical protein